MTIVRADKMASQLNRGPMRSVYSLKDPEQVLDHLLETLH